MLTLVLAALLAVATKPDPGQVAPPPRHDRQGLLPVNRDYFDMAAATGGDFYFWAPGEFAASAPALHLPLNDEAVVLDYGRFNRPHRSVAIPVESGVRMLTVFAGAQRKDRAVLVRPDGSIVAAGGDGVRLQTYRHMLIASVRDPAAGTWKLELDGAGMHSISAHVRGAGHPSTPMLLEFEFVELRGRPAHEGWFPLERNVRGGETVRCEAELAGYATDVVFAYVTRDARPIATAKLSRDVEYPSNYAGDCLVPRQPFRVVVSGRDERGVAFRRIEAALVTPE